MTQAITVQLPNDTYQAAIRIAAATNRPIADVVSDSLKHSLPPLDDVAADEADALAQLSALDDGALWRTAQTMLSDSEQHELEELLDAQSAGMLAATAAERLDALLAHYGELTVRKAHAWLLLARRGYSVPPQQTANIPD